MLLGAAGNPRTFGWIARSADGWLTTPGEEQIAEKIGALRDEWRAAGRSGEPLVTVLAGKPDLAQLAKWAEMGVSDVLFGMPDKSSAEVVLYLNRLAEKLKISLS